MLDALKFFTKPAEGEIRIEKGIRKNPFTKNGSILVGKETTSAGKENAEKTQAGNPETEKKGVKNLKKSIEKCVERIGGFGKVIEKGDTVFLKPNLNSDDHFPASTDPEFAGAVTELMFDYGAKRVVFGDSSGIYWLPTERALKLGTRKAVEKAGGEVVALESCEWKNALIDGKYLHKIALSTKPYEFDKLIYLPCMKTHRSARFTLSLKLTMGFVHLRERLGLHAGNLEEKLAEVNLAYSPDLIIMDGRKCFVSGGPSEGELEEPNVLLASGDRIAIDCEALKILKTYGKEKKLEMEIENLPQIRHAIEIGIDGGREALDYETV